MSDLRARIQVFDPKQGFAVVERRLPHWAQGGTLCFITWRTWDSMPEAIVNRWLAERNSWLRRQGIDPDHAEWRKRLVDLPPVLRAEYQTFADRWNDHLDDCHGQCVLRRAELAGEVAASLRHFDGDRYDLTDFVVMPNHVHLLAAFPNEEAMLAQCESWKHFTATKINRLLGRQGRFWQQDDFDHLVRSPEQFEFLRRYIAENPLKARLRPGEYLHLSKPM